MKLKLRVLTAAATAAAAVALGPATASPAAAGTCGQVKYNEVDSTQISISIGAPCNGVGASMWIHIPISNGWSAIGSYNSGPSGYYETIVYTCSGTNLNNYLLIYNYQDYYFSDYCGPVEP